MQYVTYQLEDKKSYLPKREFIAYGGGRRNNIKIDDVVDTFSELDEELRKKSIDECRVEFAEFVIKKYDNPFPTLKMISQNLAKHSNVPIPNIVCSQDIKTIRDSLNLSLDDMTEDISNSNNDVWDNYFEQLSASRG